MQGIGTPPNVKVCPIYTHIMSKNKLTVPVLFVDLLLFKDDDKFRILINEDVHAYVDCDTVRWDAFTIILN